jgi:DNA-binding beta-propeller fold protein YncE
MSKTQELVGGFFVQVEQIDSSKFPNVTLEIKVENRHRQPVVGLQEENFYLTENKRPVNKVRFLGAASNNTFADITLIIDRSDTSNLYKNEIETAVKEIAASMNDSGTLRVISAGAMPVTEYIGKPIGVENFTLDTLKNPVTKNVAIDLALRLATNDLITAEKKRSIILVSGGDTKDYSYSKYNLAELTSYMNNNSVGFSFIQVIQNAVSSEMDYIINNTCGDLYYIFRPEGLKNIVSEILDIPQGVYQFSYTSSMQKNFGQSYLPIEVEVYLLNRSGRDESGYFAPFE